MPSVASPREQILQAVRAWVKYCTGLADAKVLVGGNAAPRPAMPYVVVTSLLPGSLVGTSERVLSLDDDLDLLENTVGDFRGSVSVDAFGRTASDLVAAMQLRIEHSLAQAVLTPYGVGISQILSVRNALDLRDTLYEEQAGMDLEVVYRLDTPPVDAPAALIIGWDVTIESSAGDLEVTGDETLPVPLGLVP
uniref:Phage neck terminator protein gp12-like domain-containing protein n=1 Tax=viral metagenome TaxID=1070528 RepID=A0A6H1ZM14_9ZZZZ